MTNDFELLGTPHGLRPRDLRRAQLEQVGPAHPDFLVDEPALTVNSDPEPMDAAIDFASVRHVVDRMRAAFFTDRSSP